MKFIYGVDIYSRYRKSIQSVENVVNISIKSNEIVKESLDGIEYYNEIDYSTMNYNIKDIVNGLGVMNQVGYISIVRKSYQMLQEVMKLSTSEIEYVKRFFLHHEYGHLRDIFNGKKMDSKVTNQEIDRIDGLLKMYHIEAKPFEIVADKYAINDLNLSLEEYKYCRNMGRSFLQRLGNDESLNYDYSRTKVWETRHDLKRVMF